MKKIILLSAMYITMSSFLNAQTILDNSTFRIEYLLTDQIVNQYDTLVQVNLILEIENINELSKVLIFGGSEEGLSDKLFEKLDIKDQTLIDSKKLQIPDDKKISINMGIFNMARDIIYFNIKLEDSAGNVTPSLKRTY